MSPFWFTKTDDDSFTRKLHCKLSILHYRPEIVESHAFLDTIEAGSGILQPSPRLTLIPPSAFTSITSPLRRGLLIIHTFFLSFGARVHEPLVGHLIPLLSRTHLYHFCL